MKFHQGIDKTVCRSLRERESHRDVEVADILRKGMKNRLEHGLVAEYNRRFFLVFCQVGTYPLRQVTRLSVLGGRLDVGDLFRTVQVVESRSREFGGEIAEVPADEFSGFMGSFLQVEVVIIPVEQGFPGFIQTVKQLLFHFVEHVESHKHIALIRKSSDIKPVDDFAVEHAFVCDSLFSQHLSVSGIYFSQYIPERDEALFEFRHLMDGEVMEKLADGFFLSFFQKIVVICQGVQIPEVAEQSVRIGQVLVGIIEIADQHLAPEIKVVQRFLASGCFAEHPVKVAYELDGISYLQAGRLAEEFADADIGGRPDGTVGFLCQVFIEEKTGTLVREDHGQMGKVPVGFRIEIVCYLFQKGIHILLFCEVRRFLPVHS